MVRQRADNRCEYCQCHQDLLPLFTFHIDGLTSTGQGTAELFNMNNDDHCKLRAEVLRIDAIIAKHSNVLITLRRDVFCGRRTTNLAAHSLPNH